MAGDGREPAPAAGQSGQQRLPGHWDSQPEDADVPGKSVASFMYSTINPVFIAVATILLKFWVV